MIIFNFRMLTDESDNFVRDYQVEADMNLEEFNNFILNMLDYEMCMSSFFVSDQLWERHEEFTLEPMGDQRLMRDVKLQDVMRRVGDRLIFVFDMFENRSFFLQLMDVVASDDALEYPREMFAHAEAPDQYDAEKVVDDGSIFDEMMDGFEDYSDDSYNDEY